jgi:hypothetical protein
MEKILNFAMLIIHFVPQITIVIFALAVLFVIWMIIVLLMDQFYRPDTAQYPFNLILDRVIPLITLFLPTVFVIVMLPGDILWLHRYMLILIIHSFILIPLYHYWSELRSWNSAVAGSYIRPWHTPILYKQLAIGIIYPALFGIYFSLLRYLRLGTPINVDYFFDFGLVYLHWIIVFFPLILLVIFFVSLLITQIRYFLWHNFSMLIFSLHLCLLQYKPYFLFSKNMSKLYFIYNYILSWQVYPGRHNVGRFRWFIAHLHCSPWITVIVFLTIPFEAIFTLHLYYSMYLLFIFILYKSIVYIIGSFYFTHDLTFKMVICLSDYIYTDWTKVHYPPAFWSLFQESNFWYGFSIPFSETRFEEVHGLVQKYRLINLRHMRRKGALAARVSGYKINDRGPDTFCYTVHPWCVRMKAYYYTHAGVRWFHSSRILYGRGSIPEVVIHPLIVHIIDNALDCVAGYYQWELFSYSESKVPSFYIKIYQDVKIRIRQSCFYDKV